MALPNLDVSMATLEAEMIIPKNPEDTVDGRNPAPHKGWLKPYK